MAKKRPAKRKTTRRKQATRGEQRPVPAWFWLALGLVMGLGLGLYFAFSDFMPRVPQGDKPRPETTASERPEVDDLSAEAAGDQPEWKPKYDFYHILPEMEVVIPEGEIQQRTQRNEQAATKRGPYLLQVGSFRQAADAERIKAQLALLGIVAQVQRVTVNDTPWHRVRIGPYASARDADRVTRQLQDNGFEVMVLSERG